MPIHNLIESQFRERFEVVFENFLTSQKQLMLALEELTQAVYILVEDAVLDDKVTDEYLKRLEEVENKLDILAAAEPTKEYIDQ